MSVTFPTGPAIARGYAYRVQIEAESTLFPTGAAFTAHVRASVDAASTLTVLTTANGGLVRLSDRLLEIVIGAAVTQQMTPGTVVADVVRTDVSPMQHLGFSLEIPVFQPVTRDPA